MNLVFMTFNFTNLQTSRNLRSSSREHSIERERFHRRRPGHDRPEDPGATVRAPGHPARHPADGLRKDAAARAAAINDCDVAVLCLPDEAARQAVASIRNPRVRVIDASSAHRTDADWVYGFPEMSPRQSARIAEALRVSNPGCYPTGAIALLRPLVEAGACATTHPEHPCRVRVLRARTRGHRSARRPGRRNGLVLPDLRPGSPAQARAEIRLHSGLQGRPFFVPSYGSFRQGIALTIPLHASMLHRPMTAQALRDVLAERYREQRHVRVLDADQTGAMTRLDPQALNGSNDLQLAVFGSDAHDQILLSAVFDNLGKGASGAAVQNLVLMLGLARSAGGPDEQEPLHLLASA
jgi:N-acetyl-gamma-glutamyl-phosphate reductase